MPKRLRDYLNKQKWIDRFQTVNIIALARRVNNLEERMGQLRDFVTAVRSETDRNAQNIRTVAEKLQQAIDAGDPAALADLGDAVAQLHEVGNQLEAMATGTNSDPLPTPEPTNGGSGDDSRGSTPADVPTDEIGNSGQPV
jgi:hypothetical protein